MFAMHPQAVREEALMLLASGLNDCEVARRTGVPRATVRDWRRPRYVPKPSTRIICPRCWEPARRVWFSDSDYAELLGLYLGDGYIVRMRRTFRLRLFLDTAYPRIIEEARLLLDRCFAGNDVGLSRSKVSTTVLSVYSRHLPCLFPQHGPGKKHQRPIVLEDWQRVCVDTAPMNFIRGCIRSDGCYYVNRTGPYALSIVHLRESLRRHPATVRGGL